MPADVSKFLRFLQPKRAAVEKAALAAVDEFGLAVLGKASELAPVATGFLKASAHEEPAKLNGVEIEKKLSFTAAYAIYVHENLNAHHDQGQAKFLETALRQKAPLFNGFMEKRLKPAMEG
jgi:hypothetical protein